MINGGIKNNAEYSWSESNSDADHETNFSDEEDDKIVSDTELLTLENIENEKLDYFVLGHARFSIG